MNEQPADRVPPARRRAGGDERCQPGDAAAVGAGQFPHREPGLNGPVGSAGQLREQPTGKGERAGVGLAASGTRQFDAKTGDQGGVTIGTDGPHGEAGGRPPTSHGSGMTAGENEDAHEGFMT